MKNLFAKAILWNTINVLLYKILLQTHQASLFYTITPQLFGFSGIIFSFIYLLISLTNFGFDYMLFALYKHYSSQQLHQVIKLYVLRLTIILLTALCALLLLTHTNIYASYNQQCPQLLLFVLTSIFITESFKKSLEVLAQLSFLNKVITILEISTLIIYISTLWAYFFIFHQITLYTIFIPMMMTSFIENMVLIYILIKNHSPKIALNQLESLPTSSSIIKNQYFNYINQTVKSLFSPNFLILYLAYFVGLTKAAYIKFFTDSIILLYMLLNKSIGLPSGAMLSRLTDITAVKKAFLNITNKYIQFLYAIATGIVALNFSYPRNQACMQPEITSNVLFFIVAGFMEYIAITYEKLFITQNASKKLAFINSCSLIPTLICLYFAYLLPKCYLLLPFMAIRAIALLTIAYFTYKTWNICPNFKVTKITFLIILAIIIVTMGFNFVLSPLLCHH